MKIVKNAKTFVIVGVLGLSGGGASWGKIWVSSGTGWKAFTKEPKEPQRTPWGTVVENNKIPWVLEG